MTAVENPENIESLNASGGARKLLDYLETSTNPQDLRDVLEVLVRLASTNSGRKVVFSKVFASCP